MQLGKHTRVFVALEEKFERDGFAGIWLSGCLSCPSLADGLIPVLSVTGASRGCGIFLQFMPHGGPSYLVVNGESA